MTTPYYEAEGVSLFLGDALEVLKTMPECSVSACVTDPPYGLSREPDVAEVMRHWLAGDDYKHHSKGFMGKSWDSFVPGPAYWKEVYKVMKPGAHLLCFASTRTWDLMSMAIRLAGFQNRDTIRHDFGPPALGWIYGSGFPKSLDVSKQIDKMAGAEREVTKRKVYPDGKPVRVASAKSKNEGWRRPWMEEEGTTANAYETLPATEAAKRWTGWGSALKPSWEVILVFRKPLEESSIARQVLATGTGAINIAATRVGSTTRTNSSAPRAERTGFVKGFVEGTETVQHNHGRWPSNLCLSHSPGCERVGVKRVKPGNGSGTARGQEFREKKRTVYSKMNTIQEDAGYTDPDGFEEVEEWQCVEGCPVKALGDQAGNTKSGGYPAAGGKRSHVATYGKPNERGEPRFGPSEGSPARFFPTFQASPEPEEKEAITRPQGRWPSNLVLSHVSPDENGKGGCQRVGAKRVRGHSGYPHGPGGSSSQFSQKGTPTNRTEAWEGYADPDGFEEVEEWRCQPECPIRLLDKQSGNTGGRWGKASPGASNGYHGGIDRAKSNQEQRIGDTRGGASRFYPCFPGEPDVGPGFLYCAKSSRSERNKGLQEEHNLFVQRDGMPEKFLATMGDGVGQRHHNPDEPNAWSQNHHPTVKPLSLCDWLTRLCCPPGGTILDPFMGSGSIGCSAVRQGFNFIGIDQEPEYVEISRRRIEYWSSNDQKQPSRPNPPKPAPKPSESSSLAAGSEAAKKLDDQLTLFGEESA